MSCHSNIQGAVENPKDFFYRAFAQHPVQVMCDGRFIRCSRNFHCNGNKTKIEQ